MAKVEWNTPVTFKGPQKEVISSPSMTKPGQVVGDLADQLARMKVSQYRPTFGFNVPDKREIGLAETIIGRQSLARKREALESAKVDTKAAKDEYETAVRNAQSKAHKSAQDAARDKAASGGGDD